LRNKEINAALADPKLKARFGDLGGTPLALSPAEFGRLIADETENWAKVIRAPAALEALRERIKSAPDDGGLWSGPKVARWLADYHRLKSVHDQRGFDALIAMAMRSSSRGRVIPKRRARRIVPRLKKTRHDRRREQVKQVNPPQLR
jgi:hypothetical protein